MKFHVKQIILWFKNNSNPRILDFVPNKVNVITGKSGTGKSSILSIIDYCLLSSRTNIVEKVINENVSWYGMSFSINGKDFVIIRKSPTGNTGAKEVYFSSTGEIPQIPLQNNDIKSVKSIIEVEFGIDENLKIPYGGKKIVQGSKISYRYFLLFNTLSEDIIADSRMFFDFNIHDKDKYAEALDRIFFLAIGVDDVSNVLIKERIENLQKEIDKVERKKKEVDKEERLFIDKILQMLKQAQEFDLIERRLFTPDEAHKRLESLINTFKVATYSNNLEQIDTLNKRKRGIIRKIRNLERFDNEYIEYKKNLNIDSDSLRPIEYLKNNFEELIPTLEVKTFLSTLEQSLSKIKSEISQKKNISTNIKTELSTLKNELSLIENELAKLPTNTKDFTDEVAKFIFIGELKSQLKFYENKWNILDELPSTNDIYTQIEDLKQILKETTEKKKIILELLESAIQRYYDLTASMGAYKDYKVFFDETQKVLKIRHPEAVLPITNVGSKSNYMFLHLCLFLGLHEHMIKMKQKFVPQFLILDQPSQPYFPKDKGDDAQIDKDDDIIKLKDAFALLSKFIIYINKEQNTDFQIILLEHASQTYWKEPILDNFHLVDEFRNGIALIPESAINKEVL